MDRRISFRALFVLLFAATSLQAASRTFVASSGNDLNPCARPSPCRSFGAALAVTDAGGEVIVLDSAGYGPAAITQSVSIISPSGVYAGITATSGDGITVSIGSNDRVILKGLSVNGLGATYGVNFTSVGKLHLDDIVSSGFFFEVYSNGGGSLSVNRCTLRGLPGFADWGVFVSNGSALVENSVIEDCYVGVGVGATAVVIVADSHVNSCSSDALRVQTSGVLTVERVVASNSVEGLLCGCVGGTAWISASTFSGNVTGVRVCSGIVYTRGNNTFTMNTNDVTVGTLTAFSAQ